MGCVMIEKICDMCNKQKVLKEFFVAPSDGSVSWHGTSKYCIECHDAGLVKYGYGWYGDKYKKPDWVSQ